MKSFLRGIATAIALIICLILVTVYVIEYSKGIFPCPLCYIQQSALIGLIASELLNVRFGTSVKHYALANVCAILGGATAFYQLALNQFVFTAEDAAAIFSLTPYSWALMLFSIAFLVTSIILFITSDEKLPENPIAVGDFTKIVFGLAIIVALVSGIISIRHP